MDFQESSYLQQMAELGETQAVVCTENIQSADGAKLLPKGARINRQVLKRLLSTSCSSRSISPPGSRMRWITGH